jgi:hypothetical protein
MVVEKLAKLSPETVIVIGPKTSVIGGAHFGWNTAVSVRLKFAFPFCTGKSPPAPTDCLLLAEGKFSPGFRHATSAVAVAWICVSLPRPATFPDTVAVFPEMLLVGVPTKCGLPAKALGIATASAKNTEITTRIIRRILFILFPLL